MQRVPVKLSSTSQGKITFVDLGTIKDSNVSLSRLAQINVTNIFLSSQSFIQLQSPEIPTFLFNGSVDESSSSPGVPEGDYEWYFQAIKDGMKSELQFAWSSSLTEETSVSFSDIPISSTLDSLLLIRYDQNLDEWKIVAEARNLSAVQDIGQNIGDYSGIPSNEFFLRTTRLSTDYYSPNLKTLTAEFQRLKVTESAQFSFLEAINVASTGSMTSPQLTLNPSESQSSLRIGSARIQSRSSLGDFIVGDNLLFLGGSLIRGITGVSSGVLFSAGEVQIRSYSSGSGTVPSTCIAKFTSSGGFSLGTSLSSSVGSTTGAIFNVSSSGAVYFAESMRIGGASVLGSSQTVIRGTSRSLMRVERPDGAGGWSLGINGNNNKFILSSDSAGTYPSLELDAVGESFTLGSRQGATFFSGLLDLYGRTSYGNVAQVNTRIACRDNDNSAGGGSSSGPDLLQFYLRSNGATFSGISWDGSYYSGGSSLANASSRMNADGSFFLKPRSSNPAVTSNGVMFVSSVDNTLKIYLNGSIRTVTTS